MAYDLDRTPGVFAKGRERSHIRVAFVFMGLVFAASVLALAQVFSGTASVVTSLALVAVGYAAKEFFEVRFDAAIRWGKGGNAEIAVGEDLESLRQENYIVMHDLDNVVPGNVDHLVSGASGVFMIETKYKRFEDRDIPKAKGTALAIARALKTSWVQPVICLATRSYGPRIVKGVAVVGREQLLSYIRSQTKPPAPPDSLGPFADLQ